MPKDAIKLDLNGKILVSRHKSCTYKLDKYAAISLKPKPSLNVVSKSFLPSLFLKGGGSFTRLKGH